MKQIVKRISRFLKYGTLVSSLGFIGATLIQIYARFFMDSAPSWTEEAARFFFIYAMCFAAGLAMRDGSYVHFDVLYNKMNKGQQRILDIIISVFTFLLFLVLTIYAFQFVNVGLPEHSPSLDVPMAIAFGSMAIMGLFVSFFAFVDILTKMKR
ncbi:MAG: TRAP transporter small permease [Maribacter sp.]|uniref:TRAP transporter small permease n=1 Tax=Maribacter sp. TaxID=1897614 RepID=UPI003C730218